MNHKTNHYCVKLLCLLSFCHLTLPIISNPIRICAKHLGQEDKLKSPVRWDELEWNVCFVLSTCLSCAHIWIVSLRAVILPSSHGSDKVYHCKTCLFSFLCTLSSDLTPFTYVELVVLNGQGVLVKTFTYPKIPQADSF